MKIHKNLIKELKYTLVGGLSVKTILKMWINEDKTILHIVEDEDVIQIVQK